MLDVTRATWKMPVSGASALIVLVSLSVSLVSSSDCSKQCWNRGILDAESCRCECVNGFRGDLCGLPPCETECVNGSVNQTNCRCECNPGWSGLACDCDLQCDNGGELYFRFCRCRCVDGFRGLSCSELPCNTSMCVNGVQNPSTCDCRCNRGWVGRKCDCFAHCRHGGILDEEMCTCVCIDGYRGYSCALPPCQNDCVNGVLYLEDCSCECLEGWTGQTCECPVCENDGTFYQPAPGECRCVCKNGYRGPTCSLPPCDVLCDQGWVDQTNCQCNCYLGWSGTQCDCNRVCDNGGILNKTGCSCTCTRGFTGSTCRTCLTRCTDPAVLSPASCECTVPDPCSASCQEGLKLYSRTCVCMPLWVNCGQFDVPNCQLVADGGYCTSRANQASCPQSCGLCVANYTLNQTMSKSMAEGILSIHDLFNRECGPAPEVANATVIYHGQTFLSVAEYVCDVGYTRHSGMPFTQCQEDCTWLPVDVLCGVSSDAIQKRSVPDCEAPPPLQFMEVAFISTDIDAEAEYKCLTGYEPHGSGKSTCQPNKLWSIPSLACKECPECRNNGTFQLTATGKCGCQCQNTQCVNGWVDKTCQCHCYLGWSGTPCNCNRVCDNGGILNIADCSCTCTGGFTGSTCRTCLARCTEPAVLSPASCECTVPEPCDVTCAEGLRLYNRTCICTQPWVNCDQFDSANCRLVAEGNFCNSKAMQASCPQSCGLCECPECRNNGTFQLTATGKCGCQCQNTQCVNGWVDKTCQCHCYLGWSGTPCNCNRVCENGGILNVADCSCTCTGGFTGSTCRTCLARCTEPAVLSPASCECTVPEPCDVTCAEGLRLYNRTCICTQPWVNCDQFDAANCRLVAEGNFCNSKAMQASCPQSCRLCVAGYLSDQTEVTESISIPEGILSIDGIFSCDCGAAPEIDHAVIQYNQVVLTFTTVAVYICEDGYTGSGIGLTQCDEDCSWIPVDFACLAPSEAKHKRSITGCGAPPPIHFMEVAFTSTGIGSVAEYSCLTGYEAHGSGRATCQPNELWSIPSLPCKGKTSSWLLIARTSESVTHDKYMEALVDVLEKSCAPVMSVQTTSGSETTLHYLSGITGSDADIVGQSSLRMSKQTWNTFARNPRHEVTTFRTNGETRVLSVNHGQMMETSSSNADIKWWHKNESCLELVTSRQLEMDLSTGGVFHRINKQYDNGLEFPQDTPQICIDTCWHSVSDEEEILSGVTKGHELLVGFDDNQLVAKDVLVYNGHVTASIGKWVSSEVDQVWRAVQFDGRLSECRNSQDGTSFTKEQKQISWFMDTRHWSKVLSIDGHGNVLSGSKSALIDSISSSKTLRLGVVHNNNINHYMSVGTVVWQGQNEVAAEVVDHPRFERDKASRVRLSSTCLTWAAFITTEGQYNLYEYSKRDGHHKAVTDILTIDWFVH